MSYQVSRDGQLYGPYTLEDLQRYVATGNVLPSDLAKSDDMPEWLTVAQLLARSGAAIPAAPTSAYPANAPFPVHAIPYPDPPNLHWGLVLLFGIVTLGLFTVVYDLIQTLWVKKVYPASKSLTYYVIFIVLELLNLGGSFGRMSVLLHRQVQPYSASPNPMVFLSSIISIAVVVMLLVYRFTMRNDLERHFNGAEPVGLRLSGVMTFFFGGLYFQYHLNRINEIKRAMRYRGAAV